MHVLRGMFVAISLCFLASSTPSFAGSIADSIQQQEVFHLDSLKRIDPRDFDEVMRHIPGVAQFLGEVAPLEPVEIVMDGESFRYYIEALLDGSPLDPRPSDPTSSAKSRFIEALRQEILPRVVSARLYGTSVDMRVSILFREKFSVKLMDRSDVENKQLYGFDVPRLFMLSLTFKDPELVLEPLEGSKKGFVLKMKLPVISDNVYLHHVRFNPLSGDVDAEAGVVGDVFTVHARTNLYRPQPRPKRLTLREVIAYYRFALFPVWAQWSQL